MSGFMFATGIENSYPTIAGGERVDEMEKCGHYRRWRDDLRITKELGIDHLRIGPAYYLMHEAPGRYRWELFDEVVREMQRLQIEPIIDLLHFGVPDWLSNFQNPDFPRHFAEYAGAFAGRYPHIRLYTPVNEILITARFSALEGWWNERLTTDRSFVTALKHLVKANLFAMRAIEEARPDAVFVQTESFEYWHANDPSMRQKARFANQVRFLPLDLSFGVDPDPLALGYALENGMTEADLDLFRSLSSTDRRVIGIDYYVTSEHLLMADGADAQAGDALGLAELCREYYDRYGLPLMHSETNLSAERAVDWARKQWMGILRLMEEGVPVIGFTWFSLVDQMDWDTVLRENNGRVSTCGLVDLDRRIRPVGEYYRDLIAHWKGRLPHGMMASPGPSAAQSGGSVPPGSSVKTLGDAR